MSVKRATLRQLRVFEAVARNLSFTRAAEELLLTQPTVSMQMRQLTRSVGVPLFEMVGRRLFLTDAGRELQGTCREIFEHLDRFEMKVADMQGMKQGRLRLAAVSAAESLVPRLLGGFCQRYPGIAVTLEIADRDRLQERMADNLDDLYILSQLTPHFKLNADPFLENPLVVVADRNHALAKAKAVSWERLRDEVFVLRERGAATRDALESFCREREIGLAIRMELSSNEAIKQAIVGGLGISVLSRYALVLEGNNRLVSLPIVEFPLSLQWYVASSTGRKLSAIAQTFRDYLFAEGRNIALSLLEE